MSFAKLLKAAGIKGDSWYAFECFNHHDARRPGAINSASGVVFEVRIEDLGEEARLPVAACPLCGERCELRDWWPATSHGGGSSSNWAPAVFADLNDHLGRIAAALEQGNASKEGTS